MDAYTAFQALFAVKLRKDNLWAKAVRTIFDYPSGHVFTIFDLADSLGVDVHNAYNILHGSGAYRMHPSLLHGKYRILLHEADYKTRVVFYHFNERRRKELAPLLTMT